MPIFILRCTYERGSKGVPVEVFLGGKTGKNHSLDRVKDALKELLLVGVSFCHGGFRGQVLLECECELSFFLSSTNGYVFCSRFLRCIRDELSRQTGACAKDAAPKDWKRRSV